MDTRHESHEPRETYPELSPLSLQQLETLEEAEDLIGGSGEPWLSVGDELLDGRRLRWRGSILRFGRRPIPTH